MGSEKYRERSKMRSLTRYRTTHTADDISLNERDVCLLIGNNRMTDVLHHVNDAGQPELIAAADRVLIGRNRQFKTHLNFNMVLSISALVCSLLNGPYTC